MHDLRKKVLVQSGKTQSRKARAREDPRPRSSDPAESKKSPGSSPRGSPLSSRAGSRNNSRPGSRYASEDEGDDLDEFYGPTYGSESGVDSDDDGDLDVREWTGRLRNRISQLQDSRKRNVSEREITLVSYLHLIRHYYAHDQLVDSLDSTIFPALIHSIERGGSEKEVLAALNALSVTLITCPSQTIYDRVSKALKRVCEESDSEKVKVAAMKTMAISLGFEGGMQPELEDILDFLLDIVESDGQSVGAEDNGTVVTGALQAWGCVASYLDSLAETTEDGRAMEAFIEQLDSTDAEVQIAAGYNIAQIFEAARTQEKSSGKDAGLQHNQHLALTRMHDIVKSWTKRTSKKDRRQLRDEFPGIIISIDRGVGPGYTDNGRQAMASLGFENPALSRGDKKSRDTARDSNTGNEYLDEYAASHMGLQKKNRVLESQEGRIIDDWRCHARFEVLKRVLVGGMDWHWRVNPSVQSALWTPPRRNKDDDWRNSDEDEDEEDEEGEDDGE